jgi:hypothetical protein
MKNPICTRKRYKEAIRVFVSAAVDADAEARR